MSYVNPVCRRLPWLNLCCPGLPGKISWDWDSVNRYGMPSNREQADSCPNKVTYTQYAHPHCSPACFMMYIHSGISCTVFCSKISGDKTVIKQKLDPSGLGWQFKAVGDKGIKEGRKTKPWTPTDLMVKAIMWDAEFHHHSGLITWDSVHSYFFVEN